MQVIINWRGNKLQKAKIRRLAFASLVSFPFDVQAPVSETFQRKFK